MRELESLSFDRALRDAHHALNARSGPAALPAVLQDEETWHWLRESRAKDPLAPALMAWLLRLREQAQFAARRAELTRAQREVPRPISDPEQALLPLARLLELALARPRERAAYLRSYFASSAELGELVRRLWRSGRCSPNRSPRRSIRVRWRAPRSRRRRARSSPTPAPPSRP